MLAPAGQSHRAPSAAWLQVQTCRGVLTPTARPQCPPLGQGGPSPGLGVGRMAGEGPWPLGRCSLRVSLLSHKGIYILIAVGAVMMFVGFLGCYGAIQESQCLLGTVRS